MGKTPCCSKVGLRKGSWSTEEDMLLTEYIQAHGEGQWRSLPKKAGLLRCGKSCRLRWKNYLCPGIKRGNITPDEEDLIIRLHSLLGNRWTLIAGRLPNRTDNEIKNHWNTHLIKRLKNAGIEPKSNNNLAKMPKESKKPTRAGAESNNSNAKKKRKNYSSNDSNSMAADKIKIYVPKPIRVLPGFSSSNTIDSSLTSTSRNEEVNQEAIVKVSHFDAEPKAEVSHFTWPLNELGDANLRAVEVDENDQVLINGCNFSLQKFLFEEVSLQDSVPTISDMLEKVYDEYLQLL